MKRYFKAKRKKRYTLVYWLILLIISIYFNSKYMNEYSLLNNQLKINFDKDNVLLNLGLNYKKNIIKNEPLKAQAVFKEKQIKKKILLYTTHEEEEYINGNIKDAEKYLYELLKNKNYDVIMDDTKIMNEIKKNKLNYKDTYKISRKFILNNLNDDVSLIIDLHRDSGVKTTYKEYSKLMFVIGMKHDNYKKNYQVADSINKMIENINSNITRGIFTRKSSSYNQDLNENVILIELGSNNNTINEVKNTIKILVDAIELYLGE